MTDLFLAVRLLRVAHIALTAGSTASLARSPDSSGLAFAALGAYVLSIVVEAGIADRQRMSRELASAMRASPPPPAPRRPPPQGDPHPFRDLDIPTTWKPTGGPKWIPLEEAKPPLERAGLVTLAFFPARQIGGTLMIRRLGDLVDKEWTSLRWCEVRRCWTVEIVELLRLVHGLLKRGEDEQRVR